MIIDFPNMEDGVLKNFKGGEKEMPTRPFVDDAHRIMFNTLPPGASIGFHKHENTDEVMYFLSGEGKVLMSDTDERVFPGAAHYCPEGASHSLVNDGDVPLVFFAVVTNF